MEISIGGRLFYVRVREEQEDLLDDDEGWASDGVLDPEDEFWDSDDESIGSFAGESEDKDAVMGDAEVENPNEALETRAIMITAPHNLEHISNFGVGPQASEFSNDKHEKVEQFSKNVEEAENSNFPRGVHASLGVASVDPTKTTKLSFPPAQMVRRPKSI